MAKLTDRQRTLLNDYLLEKKDLITKTPDLSSAQVSAWVRENLKFDCDDSNIVARVGQNGRLYFHNWPNSESSRVGRAGSKVAFNQLVQQVACLQAWAMQAYHILVGFGFAAAPPGAIPEWNGLRDQARAELANVDHREEEEKSE